MVVVLNILVVVRVQCWAWDVVRSGVGGCCGVMYVVCERV